MGRAALLALVFLALPCSADEKEPDLSRILQVSTRFGFAYACPISSTLALTAAHVIDPKPLEKDAPLLPVIWSTANGRGDALPDSVLSIRDLGLIQGTFAAFYPIASRPPIEDEPLWILGYDWSERKKLGQRKVYQVKMRRSVGGMLIMDRSSGPGSSGSCVLNRDSEVVAIQAWGISAFNAHTLDDYTSVAVAVWGETWIGHDHP